MPLAGPRQKGAIQIPPTRVPSGYRRLNSVALAFLAGDLGSPRDILRAAWYAFDSRIGSRRRNPSPSTAFAMLRAASSMIAHRSLVCRRGPQRQFEDERRSALARHRSGDPGGVYGLQALSVESAFGACALILHPEGRGTSHFSVAPAGPPPPVCRIACGAPLASAGASPRANSREGSASRR
jgi:hypothetical protein